MRPHSCAHPGELHTCTRGAHLDNRRLAAARDGFACPGAPWDARPTPAGGLYVFAARHYSYFYVRTPGPRPHFADANRPTEAERAVTYDTFIAGAGTYSFDGRTLTLGTEFRKNPNEMGAGAVWRWQLERVTGDTVTFMFLEPPFLPDRRWRTTLLRVE